MKKFLEFTQDKDIVYIPISMIAAMYKTQEHISIYLINKGDTPLTVPINSSNLKELIKIND